MTALTWVPIFVTLTSGCSNRDPHRRDTRHRAHTHPANRRPRRPRRHHAAYHASSIFTAGGGARAGVGRWRAGAPPRRCGGGAGRPRTTSLLRHLPARAHEYGRSGRGIPSGPGHASPPVGERRGGGWGEVKPPPWGRGGGGRYQVAPPRGERVAAVRRGSATAGFPPLLLSLAPAALPGAASLLQGWGCGPAWLRVW